MFKFLILLIFFSILMLIWIYILKFDTKTFNLLFFRQERRCSSAGRGVWRSAAGRGLPSRYGDAEAENARADRGHWVGQEGVRQSTQGGHHRRGCESNFTFSKIGLIIFLQKVIFDFLILEFSDYQIQIQDISKSQKVYVSRGNVKTKIQRLRFFQAYQKFGQGIREVSNELKEMKRTGIYPAATPPRDAPSPTANDDIYATGVEAALNCKDLYVLTYLLDFSISYHSLKKGKFVDWFIKIP